MKAVIHTQYGTPDVLQIAEIEKPTPKEHQVLIKVHASSVNAADYHPRRGKPVLLRAMMGGMLKPKNPRLGSDVAGRVEAVGSAVTKFKPGDDVFGCAGGAFAEYVLAREAYVALKPGGCTFEEAAAIPVGALTALQGLRDTSGIQPGQKVLIQGASGSVGIFAIQIAKLYGAEVTAVCSTRNLEMARSLGADHVIDYKQEDFTLRPERYDLIFAVNGYHPLSAYKRVLTPTGKYVCAGGTFPQIFGAILFGRLMSNKGGRQMMSMGISHVKHKDLVTLGELLETGKITPFIDRHYPLSEIIEAFKYVEGTHPQGKVVITIGG